MLDHGVVAKRLATARAPDDGNLFGSVKNMDAPFNLLGPQPTGIVFTAVPKRFTASGAEQSPMTLTEQH
jgi:hypothetical protein